MISLMWSTTRILVCMYVCIQLCVPSLAFKYTGPKRGWWHLNPLYHQSIGGAICVFFVHFSDGDSWKPEMMHCEMMRRNNKTKKKYINLRCRLEAQQFDVVLLKDLITPKLFSQRIKMTRNKRDDDQKTVNKTCSAEGGGEGRRGNDSRARSSLRVRTPAVLQHHDVIRAAARISEQRRRRRRLLPRPPYVVPDVQQRQEG